MDNVDSGFDRRILSLSKGLWLRQAQPEKDAPRLHLPKNSLTLFKILGNGNHGYQPVGF